MAKLHRDDPEFAMQVVNKLIEEGDVAQLLIVLRQIF